MQVTEQQAKGAATTIGVGAVLAAAGAFAAWITVSTGSGFDVSKSGLDWSGDAKWLIALAALAVLGSVARVTGWKVPRFVAGSALIDGAVMLGICIYDAVQVTDRESTAKLIGGSVHIGAGLWLSLLGSALVILGGFLMIGGGPGVLAWLKGVGIVHSDPVPETAESRPASMPDGAQR